MKEKRKMTIIISIIVIAILIRLLPYIFLTIGVLIDYNTEYVFDNEDFVYTSDSIKIKDKFIIKQADSYFDSDSNCYYIIGYFSNVSSEDVSDISIKYKVFDSDNIFLGYAQTELISLEKDFTWKFKAIYSDIDANEVSDFELYQVEKY